MIRRLFTHRNINKKNFVNTIGHIPSTLYNNNNNNNYKDNEAHKIFISKQYTTIIQPNLIYPSRNFHSTSVNSNITLLGIGIATASVMYGASMALDKYEEHKASQPAQSEMKDSEGGFLGRTFYKGGFENEITKDEAAKILGIRKSASPAKIKAAHRRLLMQNQHLLVRTES